MNWRRAPLPQHLVKQGDVAFVSIAGCRSYCVSSVNGYGITATWCDQTYEGPRLGSAERPIGDTYPNISPLVQPIGEFYPTIHAAQRACEDHRRGSTQ